MSEQGISASLRHGMAVQPLGERELEAVRHFAAPPAMLYRAWSEPGLFRRWWMPESMSGITLSSCDMDVVTGGRYRLEFSDGGPQSMAFHGRYLDVRANERIVWTNEEEEGGPVTTVTFEAHEGGTLLRFHEIYPDAEARDEALQGSAAALPEQLDQLERMVQTLASQ